MGAETPVILEYDEWKFEVQSREKTRASKHNPDRGRAADGLCLMCGGIWPDSTQRRRESILHSALFAKYINSGFYGCFCNA